jgi:hypothetical protein
MHEPLKLMVPSIFLGTKRASAWQQKPSVIAVAVATKTVGIRTMSAASLPVGTAENPLA